jgi:hypothetical protein
MLSGEWQALAEGDTFDTWEAAADAWLVSVSSCEAAALSSCEAAALFVTLAVGEALAMGELADDGVT